MLTLEQKKIFKERLPILMSLIVMICFSLAMIIGNIIGSVVVNIFADPNNHGYLIQAITDLAGIGFGIGALHILKINGIFKNHKVGFFKGLFVSMFFMVLFLLLILINIQYYFTADINIVTRTLPQILIFIVAMIFIGAAEEITMRGIVFNIIFNKYGKDRAGIWFCVIISGMLFGLLHLPNATVIAFSGVMIQVVKASGMGMLLCAIYLRTKNIWLLIFIHAFNDFLALVYSGIFDVTNLEDTIASNKSTEALGVIIYIIATFVLLRNSKLKEILGTEEIKSTKKSSAQFVLGCSILVIMIAGATVLSAITQDNKVMATSFEVEVKEDTTTQFLSVKSDGTYTLDFDIINPNNNCLVYSYITKDGKAFADIGICEYFDYCNDYDMKTNKVYKLHICKIKTDRELDQFIEEKDWKFDSNLMTQYHEILPEENDKDCFIKCNVDLYES